MPAETMRDFAERCLGLTAEGAVQAAEICDLAGGGYVTYRDFRRFLSHADQQLSFQRSAEEVKAIGDLRADIRATLELADQPDGSKEQAGADAVIADALKRRGRHLDSQADVVGFEELLSDLRLPVRVAAPLIGWQATIGRAAALAQGDSVDALQGFNFRQLLDVLRRARALLQGHLDALYGACLVASTDLRTVLDFALRRPDQMLTLQELHSALKAARVELGAVDLEDVLRTLDPQHRCGVFAPELVRGFAAFRRRYSSLLGKLAGHLGQRGLSPDELFARAAHATATVQRERAFGVGLTAAAPGPPAACY